MLRYLQEMRKMTIKSYHLGRDLPPRPDKPSPLPPMPTLGGAWAGDKKNPSYRTKTKTTALGRREDADALIYASCFVTAISILVGIVSPILGGIVLFLVAFPLFLIAAVMRISAVGAGPRPYTPPTPDCPKCGWVCKTPAVLSTRNAEIQNHLLAHTVENKK
jgi:hypothetical protein